jgi:hypothetical protein
MAESGNKRKASDPMAEVRAAVREAERAEWIGNTYEIKYLQGQAENLRTNSSVLKDDELALITQQLKQKAVRERFKAAATANKLATFTCAVCLDDKPLADLHINVPCGHGFCKICIAKPVSSVPLMEVVHDGPSKTPVCYTCRCKVASTVRTYV